MLESSRAISSQMNLDELLEEMKKLKRPAHKKKTSQKPDAAQEVGWIDRWLIENLGGFQKSVKKTGETAEQSLKTAEAPEGDGDKPPKVKDRHRRRRKAETAD